MIELRHGDLFNSTADAYVNTVNCVSVMGAGIAKQFKANFPEMFKEYKIACDAGRVEIGRMHVVRRLFHPLWIINFPTKIDWRNGSKLTWIAQGLVALDEKLGQANCEDPEKGKWMKDVEKRLRKLENKEGK